MEGHNMNEVDNRLKLMNVLLTCPHRDLDSVYQIHKEIEKNDPIFYRQFAAWHSDNGQVRDHNEAFIIALALSKFDGNRDIGLALLRELPPKQIANIVDYIVGGEEKQYKEVSKMVKGKNFKFREPILDRAGKHVVKKYGLNLNVPRSMRTEIDRYFKEREEDADWFDSLVLNARKHVKWLYTILRLPHDKNGRANQILFKNNPPTDSKVADLKALAKLNDPNEQAKLIVEKKIPYRVACNVITNLTPAALLALITVMSDQELINNISSLQKRGVLDNPDLKAVVDNRLAKAKKSKKVSALKASVAADNANIDEETRKKLKDVSTAQLQKSNLKISRNIGMLVDISISMDSAKEVAKRLGSAIATALDDKNWIETVAFNDGFYFVKPKAKDLDAWEKAFAGVNVSGSTYAGQGLLALAKRGEAVDQIVIITDECENGNPSFAAAFNAYRKQFNCNPSVRIIACGNASTNIYNDLQRLGDVDVERFVFNGDYYSVPNLLSFLNKSSRFDLLMEIMSYELPQRKNS
jgi:hypothetical protein